MFMHRPIVGNLQEQVHASSMPSPGLGEWRVFYSCCPACEAVWTLQSSECFWLNRKPLCSSGPSFLSLQKSPYKVKLGSLPMSPGAGTAALLDSEVSKQPVTRMHVHPMYS